MVVDENNIDSLRIFSVDESGFSTVQKRAGKVLGKKGKHQIGALSIGERGVNSTSVCCASVSGVFVPPISFSSDKEITPLCKLVHHPEV
jgi:hypothetical protein